MANILKSFGNGLSRFFSSTSRTQPDEEGMFPVFSTYNASPKFNDYASDLEKYNAVWSNPAFCKVVCLQCDLYSLGRIKVKDSKGNEIPNDPILSLFKDPNYTQSGNQFLWDNMFNYMQGNVYCYIDNNLPSVENILYFLEAHKMEWPTEFDKYKDRLILSKATYKQITDIKVTYRYEDGSSTQIPLNKILILTDLSNGQGNWFKGRSRIDSLYKILSNADAALDSTNINIRYSGKFMVTGQVDPKDVSKLPMSEDEKKSIEQKVNGRKSVHAVKTQSDIKRFVENVGALKLDEAYRTAYFLIGSMYNIPRDVLEAYLQSSTFENQEKSVAKHVAYTLQPKGDDFFGEIATRFGYVDKTICISWDHLPFMQVFEKERAAVNNQNAQTIGLLLKYGATPDEINKQLGTNFKALKYEQPKVNSGAGSGN